MGLTNSQTPFSFDNASPYLTFHWSTTKRDILDVQPRHVEVPAVSRFMFHITWGNWMPLNVLFLFYSIRLVLLPLLLWFHLICCFYLCHSYNGAPLLQANVELQSEHNFGMRVTGKTRGRTGLKVVLRVTDPAAGQLVGNLQELTDEIQIQVRCSDCSCLRGYVCKTHCCADILE